MKLKQDMRDSMTQYKFRLIVPCLLAALAVAATTGCSNAAPAKESDARRAPHAVAVTVAPVTTRRIQRTVQVVGTFHGLEQVTIIPKASGRIVRIHHDVGDLVRPGEVLMELDDTDLRLAVDEASGRSSRNCPRSA